MQGDWTRISPQDVRRKLSETSVTLVDIRDPRSFDAGHLPAALRVDNSNLGEFLEGTDRARPLVVYCYHGNTSQPAAAFFAEQGFAEVYSMDGGYTLWRTLYPEDPLG